MKQNVLVTGGAGFIGSHIAKELIRLGCKVVILDDLSGGFKDNIPTDSRFIEGSINDTNLLEKLFNKYHFSHVYHLAAYAAEGLSHFIRKFNYENNLVGSINLINCSIRYKVKCFIFTSSIAVYGSGQTPLQEDTSPMPEDPYGISKLAVEMDLKAAHELFGLNYLIFRPHNVYGEGQNIGDKYRNVIGIFMNQIMQKAPLTVFGDGEQQRAFSYIGDISPVIAKAGFKKEVYNETFNIGADKPFTINQLISTISNAMNCKPKVNYLPARNEVKIAYSNHDKVKKMLNYKSAITLDQGIRRMAKWALKHGPRESSKFKNIEIAEKLPSNWKI